jgi:hypothetical protein
MRVPGARHGLPLGTVLLPHIRTGQKGADSRDEMNER